MSEINKAIQKVEAFYDADLLVYFGEISRNWDDHLIDICHSRSKRKNVLVMLTTHGGDAHAAYRIARCLQQSYRNSTRNGEVIIFVPSLCASAGTLITLAAHRLIMSRHAELGPLDVQIRKPDEVGERTSGLTPIQALQYLEQESQKFFKAQFQGLRFARSLSFSTKMAADIAAQLTTGLFANLYDQIDPLRLAEYDRLMRIAEEYGERIKTENVKPHAIKTLIHAYPSHEFSIDTTEALTLFNKVESPIAELDDLGERWKHIANKCIANDEVWAFYPREEIADKGASNENDPEQPNKPQQSDGIDNGEAASRATSPKVKAK